MWGFYAELCSLHLQSPNRRCQASLSHMCALLGVYNRDQMWGNWLLSHLQFLLIIKLAWTLTCSTNCHHTGLISDSIWDNVYTVLSLLPSHVDLGSETARDTTTSVMRAASLRAPNRVLKEMSYFNSVSNEIIKIVSSSMNLSHKSIPFWYWTMLHFLFPSPNILWCLSSDIVCFRFFFSFKLFQLSCKKLVCLYV